MEFALGILAGVLVAAVADVLIGFWMAAHRGRIVARVVSAEMAGHDLGLCRLLDVPKLDDLDPYDERRRQTFWEVHLNADREAPALTTSAWVELRVALIETSPDALIVPLVGWYEPLSDRALILDSQVGRAIDRFLAASAAIEKLAERSRWAGFWFVLRGAPSDDRRLQRRDPS